MFARKPVHFVAAVLTNKMTRIAWVLMARGENYQSAGI